MNLDRNTFIPVGNFSGLAHGIIAEEFRHQVVGHVDVRDGDADGGQCLYQVNCLKREREG